MNDNTAPTPIFVAFCCAVMRFIWWADVLVRRLHSTAALDSRPPGAFNSGVAQSCFFACLLASVAFADDKKDYVPKPGQFPPAGTEAYIAAGELVSVDHVNRRGALRLDGDLDDSRYHSAPSHQFAMLPYGAIWYHGAPAELRDVPIGTHLHGAFFLPPEGDTTIPPPPKGTEKYVPKYNHAITLEDDFSFHQRRGQAWKITAVDLVKGHLQAVLVGKSATEGLKDEKTFEIDRSTRIWKGHEIGELEDLHADQMVQVSLTWAPDWQNGQFQLADVWVDETSRTIAAERQRQIHIHFQHYHWLAGWVDHVEHGQGSKGIVTLTLFGGMDPSLYDEVRAQAKKNAGAGMAAAEPTLRTWWQNHDCKNGPILDLKEIPDPPPGSSGIQLRIKLDEVLEGFRPGRIIRFRPHTFPSAKLPPEERVKGMDDR